MAERCPGPEEVPRSVGLGRVALRVGTRRRHAHEDGAVAIGATGDVAVLGDGRTGCAVVESCDGGVRAFRPPVVAARGVRIRDRHLQHRGPPSQLVVLQGLTDQAAPPTPKASHWGTGFPLIDSPRAMLLPKKIRPFSTMTSLNFVYVSDLASLRTVK